MVPFRTSRKEPRGLGNGLRLLATTQLGLRVLRSLPGGLRLRILGGAKPGTEPDMLRLRTLGIAKLPDEQTKFPDEPTAGTGQTRSLVHGDVWKLLASEAPAAASGGSSRKLSLAQDEET